MHRWQVLLLGGLVGVGSLLLVPFEMLMPERGSPIGIRALAIIQPTILTALAVLLGEATSRRVGLGAPLIDAWLGGGNPGQVFRRQLPPALIAAVAVSFILVVYAIMVGRELATGAGEQAALASFDMPIITKLLYGGITEELLTRWGLVSAFAWVGWRMSGRARQPSTPVLVMAVMLAALLFAAGHLPLLFLIAPQASTGIIFAVVAGNALPGMLFGAVYIKYGLEAAMVAHMAAHLLATLALAVA